MNALASGALIIAMLAGAPTADTDSEVTIVDDSQSIACQLGCDGCEGARLFTSDRCFNGFVGPISNPVLSKDPRTVTEARLLFVNNWFPDDHILFQGGNAQVYGLQVRVALTERLSLIADKDGYIDLNPGNDALDGDGWANIAAGLKYNLIRDVENQFLLSAGFQYEFQTGEATVFQSHGDGTLSVFGVAGKEFGCKTHLLALMGHQFPMDSAENSGYLYTSLHLDHAVTPWFYPLVELNWFHYTQSGSRGIPSAVGEGDGLINIGTGNVAGNDLTTIALGAKIILMENRELGIAWETPISNREDLIDHRLIVDFVIRF